LSDGLGSGTNDVFQGGVYGSIEGGAAYLSASFAYGLNRLATDRTVILAGTDRLTADYLAHSFGGRAEAGYRIAFHEFGVIPYGALQLMAFSAPAYQETAAVGATTFALDFQRRNSTNGRAEAGAWLNKRLALDGGETQVLLRGRLAYAHDWAPDQLIGATFPALPGSNFTVMGASYAQHSALTSLAGEVRWLGGLSISAKFDGEFASGASTLMGTATVRYTW
jgi:outer membrane autotransporter protein